MNELLTYPIHTIITHERPHLDECAAIVALRRHGAQRFPGIDRAEVVVFCPAEHLDDRSEDEWLGDGYLFLGVGGGRFDDHPHDVYPDHCVFTMICEYLGLVDAPWKGLGELVLNEDRHGAPHALHIAPLVKYINRFADVYGAITFVEYGLFDGYLAAQYSFQEALKLLAEKSAVHLVRNQHTARELKVAVVDGTDNEDVGRAARMTEGIGAALVIHRNTKGRVHISPNNFQGVRDVSWLVARLRRRELELAGDSIPDWATLRADGDYAGWCHHWAAGQIMNGSLTATYVKPTKIDLAEITDAACAFLHGCRLDLSAERRREESHQRDRTVGQRSPRRSRQRR